MKDTFYKEDRIAVTFYGPNIEKYLSSKYTKEMIRSVRKRPKQFVGDKICCLHESSRQKPNDNIQKTNGKIWII